MNIIKSIFEIQGNILEKIFEDRMKRVFILFTRFIKEKMSKIIDLNPNNKKEDSIEDENINLNKEEKEIFDFRKTRKLLMEDNLYFDKLQDEYRIKILKSATHLKDISVLKEINNVKSEESKTKYISVKFQKKYGQFNKEKQNQFLEIEEKEEPKIKINLTINLNSTLKLKLEKEDNFSDITQLSSPMYLKDCLLGLSSEYPDRQKISLESLADLINNQPLDLDFLMPQLTEVLLKLDNSFELENFDELVTKNLNRLTVFNPVKMTELLCKRFFKEESGIKHKFQILSVIEKSIEEISDYYTQNKKVPKINKLHCFFENIIFPLLVHLNQMNIEKIIIFENFDYLLAKFITVIAKLIKYSENHPFIYKAIFESFELFKAIVNNKTFLIHKSLYLLDSLNLFSSVLSKFLNPNFLEIYPEFFPNFKIILHFLNDNLEKVEKEELKVEMIKNLNNYLINLEKLKEGYTITNRNNINFNII